MLDSSPVALPPVPRPLKRSASTASLPTPPRTHRKRKNGRSRASSDSDTDIGSSANDSDEGEPEGAISVHKKRRTSEVNEAEEEAFWMNATSSMLKSSKANTSSSAASDTRPVRKGKSSAEVQPPVVYRRLNNHVIDVQPPVSPPPSNRKPATGTTTPIITCSVPNSPPVTPESNVPMRDSPNNPFLDSSSPDSVARNTSSEPRTPFQEKPTVTYVFRGVRGTFPNPMYDQAKKRPLSPPANSRLPIDHPDYSPTTHCPPKLLFPNALRGKKTSSARHHTEHKGRRNNRRALSMIGSDNEDGNGLEDDSPISPIKLDFGGSPRSRRGANRGPTESSRG